MCLIPNLALLPAPEVSIAPEDVTFHYDSFGNRIEPAFAHARHYDAETGWWTSQDALGFDASEGNLFRYSSSVAEDAAPALTGRYAWSGRGLNVETDLQYNRTRYYDNTPGVWIEKDGRLTSQGIGQ